MLRLWLLLLSCGGLASAEWERQVARFEPIPQADSVAAEFVFLNVGETPLVIRRVRSSCGCTVAEYEREPVPAGAGSALLVTFQFVRKHSLQRKHIDVFFEGEEEAHRLWVEVERPQRLGLDTTYLAWRRGDSPTAKRARLTRLDLLKDLTIQSASPEIVATLIRSGEDSWDLEVTPKTTESQFRALVVLAARAPDGRIWEWEVRAGVLPTR